MNTRVLGIVCLAVGGVLGCRTGTEPDSEGVSLDAARSAALTRITVTGRPFGVDVSADRVAYVARLDENRLTRFDLPGTTPAGDVSVGNVPANVAFQPDGQRAFVAHVGGTDVGVVDVASGVQVNAIATGPNPFRVLVSPTGSYLYITMSGGNLLVVDPGSLAIVNTVFSGVAANGVATNAPGSLVYVSSVIGGLLTEHEPDGTPTGRVFNLGGAPQDVWVAPGGDVWVANESGRIDIVRPSTGQQVSVPLGCGASGLKGVHAGGVVVVTCPAAGQVLAIRRQDRVIARTFDLGGKPRRVGEDRVDGTVIVPNEGNWVDFIR